MTLGAAPTHTVRCCDDRSVLRAAQTPGFTYQGRLSDAATAPTGTYQMEFKLFDSLTLGLQQGLTITNPSVAVDAGLFTVQLDFSPATPFATGANRWLEIGVRKASDPPGFTILTPRQPITSSPYSIKTLSATSANAADTLSAACVGCVTDVRINTVAGSKVTGAVAIANGGTGATSDTDARTNLGLGTMATVSPTGTASATTFLRGDNSWGAPTAPLVFLAGGFLVPTNTSPWYTTLSGDSIFPGPNPANQPEWAGGAMPMACTFNKLYMTARSVPGIGIGGNDTISVTLTKNGVDQAALSCSLTAGTSGTVACNDTVGTVPVVAGDVVGLHFTQTSGAIIIRIGVGTSCQ